MHGKLSHHALGDRHESGAKSGAREPACFSRIVPAVLEPTLLRKGLASGVESGVSATEGTLKPIPDQTPNRFEHYECDLDPAGLEPETL